MNIALPALIINTLVNQNLREAFSLRYLFAYALGSVATFLVTYVFFARVLRRPWTAAFMAGFGSAMANTGFIGLPVVALVLGAPGLRAVPMTFLVETLVLLPAALSLAEMVGHTRKPLPEILKPTIRRLVTSPILLAIAIGSFLSGLEIHLPGPVEKTITFLASAAVPSALVIIGGMLANTRPTAAGLDPIWISLGKLALHPLAVELAFFLIGGVPAEMRAAGIILASVPTATIFPLIGIRFGHEGLCATALLIATVASLLTITMTLALVLGA